MSRIKKTVLVSVILIFIGVVGSVFAYTFLDTNSYSEERTIEESFTDISIKTNNENIELVATEDPVARVEFEGSKELKEEVTIEVRDHTLFMETAKDKKPSPIIFFPKDIKMTVYLPDSIYESLDMKTDNGNFKASELELKAVKVSSSNGEVLLEEVKSKTLNVTADNGNVHLDQVEGSISGNTINGSISLIAEEWKLPIQLETINGDIELQTNSKPENSTFDATTKNGEVNLYGEHDLNKVFGQGKHVVELTTANGNITVTE